MRLHFISFSVMFILIGIVFFLNYGLDRIKGWREMSNEEKSKIDSEKLSRSIGIVFLTIGLIFFGAYSSLWFQKKLFVWLFLAWMLSCGALVYCIQNTKIFKKK